MTEIIDGKALAAQIKEELLPRIENLKLKGIIPSLTVVLVGDDPASAVYVKNKHQTFIKLGLVSEVINMPEDTSQEQLIEQIQKLNNDETVHGILIQLPLPPHLNSQIAISSIDPSKDVDGFHIENAGALMTGNPRFIPCTPYGVMRMLESKNIPIRSSEAVVVGASNIVGKPMALLLQMAGATVTICNSKTRDLAAQTKRADILVAAAGKPLLIKGDMVKDGAVVIDVGIHRKDDGKLCGDVDFESVRDKASYITPVPGGVGPMTIVMLLVNTVEAAERKAGLEPIRKGVI
ncbi:bifunctional methylenetetrahydrofolate dehydrogenase/methenyltetrahydrofolate cyclohydrolase FolD [Taylorella equigenitalis]|uniref:Bifunctional protein FolD n=1 Tax=Taylorella equigenitalis 14/56 TaxID=1091497 RepID=I7JP94_9BURK|nr:bifunctional methylenetetrahydrofolate dehydrogenase/methenyltetrahydrofolate cyclohydrolase FolD [Taylorella equigenitalis]ASY37799.1 bifunctional methylenetetrahydrofolate dehydrogenase/methenyltetrahydrofolate cyclohydrolase FolD [Taylorella equigenitalis]ASY42220.1 bifunctional methylenetetrahydrofolate dehydrogenase/methenyltetrahydrofolate cyclohydrolase [Taylorella equigenitalis]KGK32817.1 methenyltetrahydrofolate cyclohydrolase [Taylorella equigenitalis]RBA26139.1 bifunctional methyl